MAVAVLPFIASVGDYEFEVAIAEVPYIFNVRWNERDLAWYFDLYTSDQVPIAIGLKITVGSYIGRYVNHELFENGVIAAIDTSGEYLEPGFDDIGPDKRVEVRYYTIADLVTEGYSF